MRAGLAIILSATLVGVLGGAASVVVPHILRAAPQRPILAEAKPSTVPTHKKQKSLAVAQISDVTLRTDLELTGNQYASAEWMAPTEDNVTCGVAPIGRYYIVKNPIGTTRFSEMVQDQKQRAAFGLAWQRVGCEKTSPVHQREILARLREKRSLVEDRRKLADEKVALMSWTAEQSVGRSEAFKTWQLCFINATDDARSTAELQHIVLVAMRKCGEMPS